MISKENSYLKWDKYDVVQYCLLLAGGLLGWRRGV